VDSAGVLNDLHETASLLLKDETSKSYLYFFYNYAFCNIRYVNRKSFMNLKNNEDIFAWLRDSQTSGAAGTVMTT